MNIKPNSLLKISFILGAIMDGGIALTWFLIAFGIKLPNILNGYLGTGPDYQLAMYIGAMFMAGWTVILAWGAIKPVERRGLLLITAIFLILSVVIEIALFSHMLTGIWFIIGATKRMVICSLFAVAYCYSKRKDQPNQRPL